MKFFCSDFHLNHRNILTIGNGRPYVSIQQMEEEMIKKWNAKVSPTDEVYCLGDMCWGLSSNKIRDLMNKFNGIKTLIIGNHDRHTHNRKSNAWLEMTNYKELYIDNTLVCLSHYPMIEWNGCYHKSVHLYGHVHDTFDLRDIIQYTRHKNYYCLNVGADVNNFEPISWEEVKQKINFVETEKKLTL